MDTFRQDIRDALRALRRAPGFTAVALLSLTLGIGVNSTLFSLVSAVRFRPLPYAEPSRILDLHELNPRELCDGCAVGTSYATFRDWRSATTSYTAMGAYSEDVFAISGRELPVRVQGGHVSAELFPLLGVRPILGRPIAPDEDRIGAAAVALLGHSLWEREFASDSSIVGKVFRLNGVATTIIGVMPPAFRFPEFAELWTPIAPAQTVERRNDRVVGVLARLKPGVTTMQANAELERVTAAIGSQHQDAMRNWTAGVTTLREDLDRDSGPPFYLLLGASAFVLLIACANLANLMLARALRRERDVAVRTALGASRWRVVRGLLTESTLLSLGGGALGLLMALWGIDLVRSLIPGQIPFWIDIQVDWRVALFTFLVALVTGLAFGVMPAMRVSRPGLHDVLKDGQRSVSAGRARGRMRGALVIGEVALAVVLLAGAGLMIKTYARVRRTDNLGYDPHGVLQAQAELVNKRFEEPGQTRTFATELVARLNATPGATAAAVEGTQFVGAFTGQEANLTLEGSSRAVSLAVAPTFAHAVSPRYFDVLRIPLHRGRLIAESDGAQSEGVVIVNEAAAAALWPGLDPLGRRLKLGAPNDTTARWLTVVGVVGNTVGSPLGRRGPTKLLYTAFVQAPGRSLSVLVRTVGEPAAFAPVVRQVVASLDRDQPLNDVQPMETSLANWVAPLSFFARILSALAALALGLAAIGIYGVVAYVVSQRTHEIGIRVALGASAPRVLRLVMRHGILLGGAGAILGLGGALVLTRVMRQILFNTSPTDPLVLMGVTTLLVAVAVLASVVPARRALAVNPVDALRAE